MSECNIVINAFLAGKARRIKNDESEPIDNDNIKHYIGIHQVTHQVTCRLTYHANTIAARTTTGSVLITLSGWGTKTTRKRLNYLLGRLGVRGGFSQRKYIQYLGANEIDADDVFEWVPGITTVEELISYNMIAHDRAA